MIRRINRSPSQDERRNHLKKSPWNLGQLSLAACGGGGSPTFGSEAAASERDQAEAALKAYLQARAREDWASACRGLAQSVREGYEKLGASSSKASPIAYPPGAPTTTP